MGSCGPKSQSKSCKTCTQITDLDDVFELTGVLRKGILEKVVRTITFWSLLKERVTSSANTNPGPAVCFRGYEGHVLKSDVDLHDHVPGYEK